MTDATFETAAAPHPRRDIGIKKRYAAERRFRIYGIIAIAIGIFFLIALMWSVFAKGYTAFWQTSIQLPIEIAESIVDPDGKRDTDPNVLLTANYPKLAEAAIVKLLNIDPENRQLVRAAGGLVSNGVRNQLRNLVTSDWSVIGTTQTVWVLATADVDSAVKGQVDLTVDESRRKVSDQQLEWIRQLQQAGVLEQKFNTGLFTYGASSRPETAGMGVAIIGSLFMMLIVLILALPIGVAASIYLEEFAPKNRFTDLIEVNINNLAAVPSIVFGLLGLAVFINFMELPRSASLVGGLVLTLMTLADDHHRHACRVAGRAALDPRRRPRPRRLEDADGVPSRPAARRARYPDRHDHRTGPGTRRDGAAAPDRDGGLRGELSDLAARSGDRIARADLHVGQRSRARLRGADLRRHHHPADVPGGHEHRRHHTSPALRTPLVME